MHTSFGIHILITKDRWKMITLLCSYHHAICFLICSICQEICSQCRLCRILWFITGLVYPDSKVHGAHMGTTWGRQDPGGPHVGPMNLAILVPSSFRITSLTPGALLTLILAWINNYSHYKVWGEITHPFKFGNGLVISSHTLLSNHAPAFYWALIGQSNTTCLKQVTLKHDNVNFR